MRLVNNFKLPIEKIKPKDNAENSTYNTFYSTARNDSTAKKIQSRTNVTNQTHPSESSPDLTSKRKSVQDLAADPRSFISPKRKNFRISYLSEQSFNSMRKNIPDLEKNNHRTELQPEAGEIMEEKTPEKSQGYKEYRKNMANFVVDKDLNYLYFKAKEAKSDEATKMFYNNELMKLMTKKYEHLKPDEIAKALLKDDNRPKTAQNYQKNKLHIAQMSEKTKKTIEVKMDIIKSSKIAEEARKEIDKLTTLNAEVIEKLAFENSHLKEENDILKNSNSDLKAENGILLRKSQILSQEIMRLREEDEGLRKKFSVLETFRPAYNMLCNKFPNEDVRAIIAKFDRLTDYVTEYTKTINNLELEIANIKKEKEKLNDVISTKDHLIGNEIIERNKIITTYRNEIDSRDLVLSENATFKDMYFKLFNRVLSMYTDWSSAITVFDGKNKLDIKPDLSDPFKLLDTMSKMIRISTNENLQKYLTKIIVSANQLVRRYFPSAIHDKFDPDKIYERTQKYIDKLHYELKRLNPKYEEIKADI